MLEGIDLKALKQVRNLPVEDQREVLELLEDLEETQKQEVARDTFLGFTRYVWPAFIEGRHHKVIAKAFERVIRGDLKRLIINMPPRHTKSEFASYLLPAWFLGQNPEKKVIQASHTAELSVGFGRKVRNLVDSEDFKEVFPALSLRADSKAAGRWSTSQGGEYFAIGVGGAVAGKGADLLIIDDPHSEQDGQSIDPAVFDKTYEWYTSGPRQRLQPGGAIIIVMCMTGDTPVLMGDGTEKPLAGLQIGDQVATYSKGQLATSTVNNHQSSGLDTVYTIQTQSGNLVRANENHPFLVKRNGETEWVRLKNLNPGDSLVSLKDAPGLQEQRQSPENANLANLRKVTTEKTLMHLIGQLVSTENGKVRNASVVRGFMAKAYALVAITKNSHQESQRQGKIEQDVSKTVTESHWSSMKQWLLSVITDVMFAARSLIPQTPAPIGEGNSASIIVTTLGKSEDYYAMTATLQLDTEKYQKPFTKRLNTYGFTTDKIKSIFESGIEEVFDVEIDGTENFIANGLVSHNTRWHLRDLTGKIIKASTQRDGVDEWELIEFPAIMPSGNALWPEFWSQEELLALQSELPAPKWAAQYQQEPTSEGGALVKREWWKRWEADNPPQCDFIIQSWDTAFLKTRRADYSACTTWGVFYHPDDEGRTRPNIILLDAHKERLEFPELKKKAMEFYNDWQPDACIIEAKAAGAPLVFELRAMGIPVSEYTPSRGNDKVARVNAVADMFASGVVWCPETRFGEMVIEEFASFPVGEHDDLVDSSTQALLRFRQGGFLRLNTDEEDEPMYRKRAAYY
jgi:predicted phage terminase large subunit-like protein